MCAAGVLSQRDAFLRAAVAALPTDRAVFAAAPAVLPAARAVDLAALVNSRPLLVASFRLRVAAAFFAAAERCALVCAIQYLSRRSMNAYPPAFAASP